MFRAALVNYQILAKVAEQIGLEDFILMSRGERKGYRQGARGHFGECDGGADRRDLS